jgi:type II secretory pathway component PulF
MWILYLINIAVFLGFIILAWKKPGIGLIFLLPTAAWIFFSGLISFDRSGTVPDEAIIMYVFSIILLPLSLCIIHWGPSSSRLETPWYKTVTNVIMTLFKYILILALFCVVFQFLGPIFFILFLVATSQFAQAQKFGLAMDITSTIGTSIRQSLPLPMALTMAAHGQKKKEAHIFNNIAHWLTQGWLLSEALRRGYPRCPSNILASITTAEKMNQLPKAIESLQVDLSEKVNDYKATKPVEPVYPLVVLVIVFTVMMALTIFIVPTFAEVLADMSDGQAGLPAATQSLLDLSGCFWGRKGLNGLLVVLVFFCIISFTMYIRCRNRTPQKPRFLSRLGDRIKWYTPVLHWFERTFGNLYLVQSLRIGLIAGYPVNTILRNALELDINRCYQKRLEKWLIKIEAGDDIAQSAKACGLDKTLAWAFDEKVNKGNTPKILEGLEEVYRNQYNYRKNVLAAASEPLVILCLGLIVGYVVYAMFMGIFSTITVTLQYTIPQ